MAKRRTISYRNTAIMAVAFTGVAATFTVVELFARASGTDLGALGMPMGAIGLTLWFLGTAMSILAISTEYKKASITGLVLSAVAILLFMLTPTLTG